MTKRRALALTGIFTALVVALLLGTENPLLGRRAGSPDAAARRTSSIAPADRGPASTSSRTTPTTPSTGAAPVTPANLPAPTTSATPAAVALSEAELRAKIRAGEPGFEVLASRLAPETGRIEPRWREGDEWLVETYYRQMQAPEQTWTGPAVFRFRVEREVSFRDRPCYEIVVSSTDDAAMDPAVFYVTRDGRLAGQSTTVVQQGKKRTVVTLPEDETSREPAVIRASLSLTPFTLPPLGAEARVAPAGLAKEPPARGRDRAARAHMPKADELVGAGGDYLDLEFEDPNDKTTVTQRWCRDDMRWPVVSRTPTTVSFRRKS